MSAKDRFKKSLAKAFRWGQHLGIDVLPRHFYSEIPVIHQLRKTEHWRNPYSMIAVQGADVAGQAAFVAETVSDDVRRHFETHDVYDDACRENGVAGYGPIEAKFLFAFVAKRKPTQIVQIGCGVSTALCIAAAKFAGYKPRIVCVEPYPSEFLSGAAKRGDIELIAQPVEVIGFDFFASMREGDFFFVDSTHTLGPAGEVTRIIVEMLPRLPVGAYAHFHDIMFPFDYSPGILDETLFFWHETALLLAFLTMNPSYRICASLAQLHNAQQAALAAVFPEYEPAKMDRGLAVGPGQIPSAIYLQVVAPGKS